VSDAVALVGERYSIPLIRELRYGYSRFSDLAALTGAPRSLLTARLRKLEEAGVIERIQYSERPPRYEYRLTQAGQDLLPVLVAFKEWGDHHCRGDHQTVIFRHDCGAELHTKTVCSACSREVRFEDLTIVGGTHPPVLPGVAEPS
jgi:DNA-binding HxlR family transcriptional regulator